MDDHYFSADPAVAFKRQPVVADVWGHRLALTSGSGVFAQGRLDVGTAVLFRETEPPRAGSYLDLGSPLAAKKGVEDSFRAPPTGASRVPGTPAP